MSKLKVTQCQGEGQGSCKRCNDNGKWNRAWMDFLYKVEGYEGCYCRDCVKELQKEQEERKVRTVEEIKKDYEETKVNDELVQDSHYKNCYEYKNKPKRKKLREEYISTLPANKQLAIYLHSKLCTYEHTSYCGWYYEINGLEDDWDRFSHKKYLEKANNILSITSDIELVKKLIDVIRK